MESVSRRDWLGTTGLAALAVMAGSEIRGPAAANAQARPAEGLISALKAASMVPR